MKERWDKRKREEPQYNDSEGERHMVRKQEVNQREGMVHREQRQW